MTSKTINHIFIHDGKLSTNEVKWISVKDKLPTDNTSVLCWYEYYRYGDYNCMYQTYGIGYYVNGYWSGEVSNGHQTKVLYWMHLPEPPITDERSESKESE